MAISSLFFQIFSPALAQQPNLPRASARARGQLAQLKALVAGEQWEEAVELIRSLSDLEPQALVETELHGKARELGFHHYQPMRDYLQRRLLRWSHDAPALASVYRQQVDSTARELLRMGQSSNDPAKLEYIVRNYTASSIAQEASWALSEIALQQGKLLTSLECLQLCDPATRLAQGQASWRGLATLPATQLSQAIEGVAAVPLRDRLFPHFERTREISQADVWARLCLRAMVAGNNAQADLWLRVLARVTPSAKGVLWGSPVVWSDRLQEMRAESQKWPAIHQHEWPSYAGTSDRNARIPPIEFTGDLLWSRSIPKLAAPNAVGSATTPPVGDQWTGLRYCFPIGRDAQIWWEQPGGWHAVGVATGRSISKSSANGSTLVWENGSRESAWLTRVGRYEGRPQFDLHAHEELVLGRDRRLSLSDDDIRVRQRSDSLAAWDAEEGILRFQWELPEGNFFSGPPVAANGLAFAMTRSRNPTQPSWRVMAWSLSTGKLVWELDLGSARDSSAQLVFANDRLTVVEDRLFVITHAGVVASIRARDGRLLWLVEYPRESPVPSRPEAVFGRHWYRRGTPVLVDDDIVIALAADCRRIFALDAVTGAVLWATIPGAAEDACHIMGIVDHKLIVTGDRVYWLDTLSGRLAGAFPAGGADGLEDALPVPRGLGRGLIAGGVLYWPTSDQIWRIDAATGMVREDPIELRRWGLQGGNLMWHQDVMILTDDDRMAAFAAPAQPVR